MHQYTPCAAKQAAQQSHVVLERPSWHRLARLTLSLPQTVRHDAPKARLLALVAAMATFTDAEQVR